MFRYAYDFGDSWELEIRVEKIVPAEHSMPTTAVCMDGARACPPEDCGGAWGYADLLESLADPKHPEHRNMKKWLGRRFDPEAFDLGRINLSLRGLKWPSVTEAQLRKVLMSQDG